MYIIKEISITNYNGTIEIKICLFSYYHTKLAYYPIMLFIYTIKSWKEAKILAVKWSNYWQFTTLDFQ